jgi:hypothetical protein
LPGNPDNLDPRQLAAELQQTARDIQAIEGVLGRNNPQVQELRKIEAALNNLANSRSAGDPADLQRLTQEVVEPFRNLELELSRKLELLTQKDVVRSAREEDIPAGTKKQTEKYYIEIGK